MKKTLIIIALILLTVVAAFLFVNRNKNSKKVDVSHIDVQLDINRYDQKFMAVDANNIISSLRSLRQQDTTFFDFYTVQLMRFGALSDTIGPVTKGITEFLTNPYVHEMYDTVQEVYGNLNAFESDLTEAFKHFKYYFPNKELPEVYTMISEFSYNAVTLDTNVLAISLELYLGKEYKYYYSFDFPQYVINRFEPQYMVPNCMEVLYQAHFVDNNWDATDALIYAMIENGKKLYFMECMQPEVSKEIFIGYTPEQLAWCEAEEAQIWKFYSEKDLFYSKDYMEHKRHVNDGPITPGMPTTAPGNVGSWVGWQIVDQFMENANSEVDLATMLTLSPEVILAKSGYKPKE